MNKANAFNSHILYKKPSGSQGRDRKALTKRVEKKEKKLGHEGCQTPMSRFHRLQGLKESWCLVKRR